MTEKKNNTNKIEITEINKYFEILSEYEKKYINIALLYQMGSFYENYGYIDDEGKQVNNTPELSVLLNIVFARHNKKKPISKKNPQMIGIPISKLEKYLRPLITAGYNIIVYNQSPEDKKKRELYRIFTPGTYVEDNYAELPMSKGILSIYLNELRNKLSLTDADIVYSFGGSYIDSTTGDIRCQETIRTNLDSIYDEIHRFIHSNNPAEILVYLDGHNEGIFKDYFGTDNTIKFMKLNPEYIKITYQNEFLKKKFGDYQNNNDLTMIEELDLELAPNAVISLISLLQYIYEHNELLLKRISKPSINTSENYLVLSNNALAQMEIMRNIGPTCSIPGVTRVSSNCPSILDMYNKYISTMMGKRLFQQWLTRPECDPDILNNRYTIVNLFKNNEEMIREITNNLKQMFDMSILLRKLSIQSIHPYEIVRLLRTCENYRAILELLKGNEFLKKTFCKETLIVVLDNVIKSINNLLNIDFIENNQETIKQNDITVDIFMNNNDTIKEIKKKIEETSRIPLEIMNHLNKCYYDKIDEDKIKRYEEKKKKKTLRTIKNTSLINMPEELPPNKKIIDKNDTIVSTSGLVSNNQNNTKQLRPNIIYMKTKPYGKGIIHELSTTITRWNIIKSKLIDINLFNMYKTYINKSNTKLTITCNDLIEVNNRLMQGDNNTYLRREYYDIIDSINDIFKFEDTIRSISEISIYIAMAIVAIKYGYTKPTILERKDKSSYLDIKAIRHPIVERMNEDNEFITNDIRLGKSDINTGSSWTSDGILLFGLNTCGKSVLLKSIGIAIILAQIGSFVPCATMTYYPYNTIIPRISYDDNLYKKQSSFAVEMAELRAILKNANKNTLVLGDEICKGTEIESAIPIVSSSIKTLCENNVSFIITSHLHKLCKLDVIKSLTNLAIMHLSVEITDSEIIYKRKLCMGNGPTSYGIEVCKTLGMSKSFIDECYKIKNMIREKKKNNELLVTKKSRYNSQIYMDKCYKCNSRKDLHTHHILHQKIADKNGIINIEGKAPFHKDKKHNLMVLCKDCHHNKHNEHNINNTI